MNRKRFQLATMMTLLLCAGCYSVQMMPPVTLQAADDHGNPIQGIAGSWEGQYLDQWVSDQRFTFDQAGQTQLPRYEVQSNVSKFLAALCNSFWPHQSVPGDPWVHISIEIPSGYEVDEEASHLKRDNNYVSGGGISWENHDDAQVYLSYADPALADTGPLRKYAYDRIMIGPSRPASTGPKEYHFVFRRKPGATQPVPRDVK